MKYPSLVLKKGKERATQNRHPWIFSGAIKKVDAKVAEGDIVQVLTAEGETVGYGFFGQRGIISCRVFEFTTKDKVFFNDSYWKSKIEKAYQLRKSFVLDDKTTACRIIHAEGDFFPGVIADLYNDVLVLDLLIPGTKILEEDFKSYFKDVLGVKEVYVRANKPQNEDEHGVIFKEWDIQYKADVAGGQKTGFFLDQRDSRKLIRNYSEGKNVLNTFSYSGGFSLNALAADAKLVHSVDLSAKAIAECETNIELNKELLGAKTDNHEAFVADCFDFLKDMKDSFYDVIVLDPPAFTKHKKTVNQATRGYKQLNLKALNKIKSGGILFTYSCSQHISKDLFRKIVFGAAADAGRNVQILHQIGHSIDHPINIYHPENEYLKGLVLLVD